MKKLLVTMTAAASMTLSGHALANTGGGATIHNAATLSYTADIGGVATPMQYTNWINVKVATIASAPTILSSTSSPVNAGQIATVTYTIVSTSNGVDGYNFSAIATPNNIGAAGTFTFNPASLTLGASIVISATEIDADTGTISIPAGSENGLQINDLVQMSVNGTDHQFKITHIEPGVPASTTGHITELETHTVITLDAQTGQGISAANVQAGTQVGEVATLTASFTTGTVIDDGDPASYDIGLTITTNGTDANGATPSTTDSSGSVSVISGTATLIKEVRNLTPNGNAAAPTFWHSDNSPSASVLTAKTGETLEYRLTAQSVTGADATGAVLADSIPPYTTYVPGSTTLNGVAVADVNGTSALVCTSSTQCDGTPGRGLLIHTPSGNAATGELIDGETAIVTFQVTVD